MTAAPAGVAGPALALVRATIRYPGAVAAALRDASFAVSPGECVGIVGPNGAGKTTALRALLGSAPLETGRALVLGRDASGWAPDALARAVGVVGQREEPAFPVTVIEAVRMGRYAHLGPWRGLGVGDHDAVARAMARADVAALAERWAETLSGGEWQRVRVARALAQEPRALVLDEPTSSLDVRHEMELFELVASLARADGLAALLVSHHINAAARFCDRLVLVAGGAVVADGPPADVLDADRLSAVFDWPIAVHRLADGAPQLLPERRPAAGGKR